MSMTWDLSLPDAHLVTFDRVDSTNLAAKRLAAEGAGHLTLVVAREQTAGRGRLGRRWSSLAGNVYWSMILRPTASWPALGTLPFVSALSVKTCLDRLTEGRTGFSIKWPNDVLCDGKKICGILHESESGGRPGQSASVVVGIGINVDEHPTADVLYPTTSLRNEGYEIGRDAVITALTRTYIDVLSRWLASGYPAIRNDLTQSMTGIGKRITVRTGTDPAQHRSGLFKGLDEHGRLILEVTPGVETAVAAGDVFLTGESDTGGD
jgi:BirA family transcriptional regulator, biotin operon repressor / biotin---[acetyl-CoA-carboxylase] ligase